MRQVSAVLEFSILPVVLFVISAISVAAQQPAATVSVPRLINISGVFRPADGQPPGAVEMVTLAIYAEEHGGEPLWQETQTVAVDRSGRYMLLMGATLPGGIPADVFASDAKWLGTRFDRAGDVEGPRTRITSVPYALRAAEADTLGGYPASAYVLATTAGSSDLRTADAAGSGPVVNIVQPGTTNFVAKYVNSSDVGNSALFETNGQVGLGTTTPFDRIHVRFTNTTGSATGLAVQNLGNTATSFSGMLFYDQNGALGQFQGFNNVTHEYRINNIASGGSINFMLGGASKFLVASTGDISIAGRLLKGGSRFLYSDDDLDNTFAGLNSGNFSVTGNSNSGFGASALELTTTGSANTATGAFAMADNTTGDWNTAVGAGALAGNDSSHWNTAVGTFALNVSTAEANTAYGNESLVNTTIGCCNVGIGSNTLQNNTTGSGNTALGDFAGFNATSGSNNIYIGANVNGAAGESDTMYLGSVGIQTRTFIAGVRGTTTSVADAVTVMIDSNGQLGTVNSSRRYKHDIRDMGDASSALMRLRPVTFRYSQPYADGSTPIDYGLIAEEVDLVYPDLVAHLADGRIETVQYHKINAMLLNEFQKQYRAVVEQRAQIEAQRAEIELLKARLAALEARR